MNKSCPKNKKLHHKMSYKEKSLLLNKNSCDVRKLRRLVKKHNMLYFI